MVAGIGGECGGGATPLEWCPEAAAGAALLPAQLRRVTKLLTGVGLNLDMHPVTKRHHTQVSRHTNSLKNPRAPPAARGASRIP